MILVAGLGNPGSEYDYTRHNIGFAFVDMLHTNRALPHSSSWQSKDKAMSSTIELAGEKLLLVKPQSYMNLSGEPIGALLRFYKIAVEDLIVVHDDIDLPLGSIRIKKGGGDAGHNGLKSISKMVGTREYHRVRLGVGRPDGEKAGMEVSSWVLGRFSSEEQGVVDTLLKTGEGAISTLLTSGLKKAQNMYH